MHTLDDGIPAWLTRHGVPYTRREPTDTVTTITVGDGPAMAADTTALASALGVAGYPKAADASRMNKPMVVLLLAVLMLLVTMVYGPIAAYLVELFPTRIRYTSMSLPYHIGNGWFGGFLPATAFAIVAATGNIYSGLWYPIVVAGVGLLIGLLLLPETRQRPLD